jgi:C1A family cysteine protease
MRCNRILVLLTFVTIIGLTEGRLRASSWYEGRFKTWMQRFRKRFNEGEFGERLRIWAENDDIIQRNNAQNNGFVLSHNKFSDLSLAEFKAIYLPHHMKPRAVWRTNRTVHVYKGEQLPPSVDWVTMGGVSPVKSQGQCGSCWTFSTTGAMEGAYHRKHGKLPGPLGFSEQQLVSCDMTNQGCNGGLMDDAFQWVEKNGGLCADEFYPYSSGQGVRGTCNTSCTPVLESTPTKYTDVEANSEQALMSAVAQQPVSVAIQADKSVFQLYSSGVLTDTCGTDLDHGVLVVGYGTLNGTDYWKVKNSWGTTYGIDGYVLLQRGKKSLFNHKGECGILSGPPSYPTI